MKREHTYSKTMSPEEHFTELLGLEECFHGQIRLGEAGLSEQLLFVCCGFYCSTSQNLLLPIINLQAEVGISYA